MAHETLFLSVTARRLLPLGGLLMVRGYTNSDAQFAIDSFAAAHDEIAKRGYCGEDTACFRKKIAVSPSAPAEAVLMLIAGTRRF
jgi:hypothetical protein